MEERVTRTVTVCVTKFTAVRPVRSVTVCMDGAMGRSAIVSPGTQVSPTEIQVPQQIEMIYYRRILHVFWYHPSNFLIRNFFPLQHNLYSTG